jgi:flagellar protein FlaJ
MNRIFSTLGKVYPWRFQNAVSNLLKYSDSSTEPTVWLGKVFVFTLTFLIFIGVLWYYFVLDIVSILLLPVTLLAVIILLQSLAYIVPYYAAERRAKEVEKVLPSFYQLVASYMRSGMTPFQALKSASKKEFGVLQVELDKATSKALGTESFSDALLAMSSTIKSDNLKRSTELMVRGMDSGGSLATLLEESAANIIENKSLKRQIIAASRTYTVMVIFAVVVGAPLLLSISTRFNERLIDMTAEISSAVDIQGMDMGLLGGGGSINPDFLMNASLFTVAMTALISSFLVGIISEGKEKYGLKYAMMFVPLSVILFYVFTYALRTMF